jgi:hypothetical protein
MIAVAVVAVFLATLQADPSVQLVAGGLIVASCIAVLAGKWTLDSIAIRRSAGLSIRPWDWIWAGLGSAMTALLVIGLADFLFLFLYAIIENGGRLGRIDPVGFIGGLLGTVVGVTGLRSARRPKASDSS